METLVIYDSLYGNTEKVAKEIGKYLQADVSVITKLNPHQLQKYQLLIFGSPTHGGRPTPEMTNFIQKIPSLKNTQVAAFDTRFVTRDHGIGLRIVMNIIHFAAEKMSHELKAKGGKEVVKPIGFIVEDKKGPLKQGELLRALKWAQSIEHTYTHRHDFLQ